MMKQKLELTWIGKGDNPRLEPRILLPTETHGDASSGNMLIHGDNLLALKALEQDYAGKVKCIYIDPPYNTGNAFEHYDDGVEHSVWLNLMHARLVLLRNLLSKDGSIWISIDSDESHYLKVMMDEVFGRNNFVDEVVWQRSFSPINLKKTLSRSHDIMFVYSKSHEGFTLNKLKRSAAQSKSYKNPDNDLRGPWTSSDCTVGPVIESKLYKITTPSGRIVMPPDGRCWLFTQERFEEMKADNRIWFGKKGENRPRVKKFLSEVKKGVVAMTLWLRDDVGDNQEAKREIKALFPKDVFTTPKPERLIERVLTLGSSEGDLVLDSFLGSGTTAAVAHKMNRKWIGIELGDHAHTHCVPRMQKVINGEDAGGITKAVNWEGGGGFTVYELAPTLIMKDEYGIEVINPKYNPDMLANAMAKHEGFTYAPDAEMYWKQGQSTENAFIYTTTQMLTVEKLDKIHEQMTETESLVICAAAFQPACRTRYPNITIKKIPKAVLGRCEFGKEDYSLNVEEIPGADSIEDQTTVSDEEVEQKPDLFSQAA